MGASVLEQQTGVPKRHQRGLLSWAAVRGRRVSKGRKRERGCVIVGVRRSAFAVKISWKFESRRKPGLKGN